MFASIRLLSYISTQFTNVVEHPIGNLIILIHVMKCCKNSLFYICLFCCVYEFVSHKIKATVAIRTHEILMNYKKKIVFAYRLHNKQAITVLCRGTSLKHVQKSYNSFAATDDRNKLCIVSKLRQNMYANCFLGYALKFGEYKSE